MSAAEKQLEYALAQRDEARAEVERLRKALQRIADCEAGALGWPEAEIAQEALDAQGGAE